jgi:hypothetical protein
MDSPASPTYRFLPALAISLYAAAGRRQFKTGSARCRADNSANAEISAELFSISLNISVSYAWSFHCTYFLSFRPQTSRMTLQIEKIFARRKRVIRLSARQQSEHLDEFKTQIKGDHSPIALDLDGVTLVDVEVIRFLNGCEESGVELLHCSPYIVQDRQGRHVKSLSRPAA